MRDDYLAHHGIKGQKWGVRRYQNEDGSLTAAGKKRYLTKEGNLTKEGKELQKKIAEGVIDENRLGKKTYLKADLAKKLNVEQGDTYDMLKSGAELRRLAGNDDVIDERRKYVSLTPRDEWLYDDDMYALPLGKDPQDFRYETLKDLKIAKPKEVLDHIVEKYGDTKISDFTKESDSPKWGERLNKLLKDYGEVKIKDIHADYDAIYKMTRSQFGPNNKSGEKPKDVKWLQDRADYLEGRYGSFIGSKLSGIDSKESKEIFKEFKNRGYDAVLDPEDVRNFYQYPLILLNPKETIKQKSKKPVKM